MTERTIGGPLSPCVGVCLLDPATGLCAGCARSGPEIGAWRDAPPAVRAAVWAELPARATGMGLAALLLPWSAADIRDHVARRLAAGGWCALGNGAAGLFRGPAELRRSGATLTAIAAEATLRLTIGAATRAFARPGGEVALGLPEARRRGARPSPPELRGVCWLTETALGSVEIRGACVPSGPPLPELPLPFVAGALLDA